MKLDLAKIASEQNKIKERNAKASAYSKQVAELRADRKAGWMALLVLVLVVVGCL